MEQKVSLPHNRPPGQVLAVADCGAGARDGETKLGAAEVRKADTSVTVGTGVSIGAGASEESITGGQL